MLNGDSRGPTYATTGFPSSPAVKGTSASPSPTSPLSPPA
jgi:hypothetical protein